MLNTHSKVKGFNKSLIAQTKLDQKNLKIANHNRTLKQLLHQLVFQIFLLIADSDGEIDPKEVHLFRSFLSQREKNCSNPYSKRIFHATVANFPLLLEQYHKDKIVKSFKQVEKTMILVERTASLEIVTAMCKDLEELALSIAKASGGFVGLGKKISDEEDEMLSQLTSLFADTIAKASARQKQKQEETSNSKVDA